MPEPTITDWYGNQAILDGCTLLTGFDDNRAAYQMSRTDLSALWGDWEAIGSAVDYPDNTIFAVYNGCPYSLDTPTSLAHHGG